MAEKSSLSFATAIAVAMLFTTANSSVLAVVATIDDNTPGSATNDGVINAGEYVGSTSGINSGFGNVIGSGSQLFIDSSTSGALNFGLRRGTGNFNDAAVIYIDTFIGNQFSSTNALTDNSSRGRAAISGVGEFSGQSNVTFAPSFAADYAVAISMNFGFTHADLYQLNADGSLSLVTGGNMLPANASPSTAEVEWQYNLSNLGLSPGDSFNYVATYLNPGDAFRSDEFHGVASFSGGNPGATDITLSTGDFNTFNSVAIPEPSAFLFGSLICSVLGVNLARRRGR